jgi:hypothetical protein
MRLKPKLRRDAYSANFTLGDFNVLMGDVMSLLRCLCNRERKRILGLIFPVVKFHVMSEKWRADRLVYHSYYPFGPDATQRGPTVQRWLD